MDRSTRTPAIQSEGSYDRWITAGWIYKIAGLILGEERAAKDEIEIIAFRTFTALNYF